MEGRHPPGEQRCGLVLTLLRPLVTERINAAGYAIASIRLSVRLFALYLQNRLTTDLELLRVSRS